MGLLWAALLLTAGCGRIGFDGQSDGGDGSSLRLHVRFEGALTDDTGRHTVSCADCPMFGASRSAALGLAGEFTGTQCLAIADAPEFRSQVYTAALWFFRVSFDLKQTLFTKPYDATTGSKNSWEMYLAADRLQFATSNGQGNQITTGGLVVLDTWHHLAVTFDNGDKRVYVDGTLTGMETSTASQYDGEMLRIGCERNEGTEAQFVEGHIDDVRFYVSALSAAEIALLAQ